MAEETQPGQTTPPNTPQKGYPKDEKVSPLMAEYIHKLNQPKVYPTDNERRGNISNIPYICPACGKSGQIKTTTNKSWVCLNCGYSSLLI